MANKNQFSDSLTTEVMRVCSDGLMTSSRIWLRVKDVMNKDVITISSDETVVSAAKVMSENNVSCIAVVDDGSMAGILTEKDLLTKIAGGEMDSDKITVSKIMSCPVESISPDLTVFDASTIMESKHIKRLPVLVGNRLVGIVTQTDLTRALTSYGMWKDVAEIMSSDMAVIEPKRTVAEAVEIMNSRNISCIVALEGNQVRGIVTERDLLKRVVALEKHPAHTAVEEVMSSPVTTIPPTYSIFSARKVLDKMHIRRLVVTEGERLCGIVTQTDIFRAMKKKLQEEEEKSSQLLDHSENNIYTLDSDGKIIYVNSAFMKLFEVSDPAELINRSFLPERFWVNLEERTSCLIELKKGDVEIKELSLRSSKGNSIYVTLFSTVTKNIHGEINGTQGILYDITDRKLAEESAASSYKNLKETHQELKRMQSQLVQNEKLASLGQLAAGVAHEINTPVGFVASNFQTLGSYVKKFQNLLVAYENIIAKIATSEKEQLLKEADAIKQTWNDMNMDFVLEDIRELFDDSREGLDRVTSIIQNLRDFSRVDQPGSRDEYSFNKGIESTLVVARNAIKYDATIKTEFSDVPGIFCNPGQINQVLLNILVNAAQAIKSQERDDEGTITIKTYASDDGVVCEICDDGPGIAPDNLSKVFDPFFTTKPTGKGTGLGLSVSYDIIVNKHGGELLADSTVGEGTKFTIKLPIGTKENGEKEIISDGRADSIIR